MSYINFTITGKMIKEKIIRKLSDFYSLRDKMIKRWPGIYIPSLPPRQTLGRKDKEMIEFQIKILNTFCEKVSRYDFLLNSDELKLFLVNISEPSKSIERLQDPEYNVILNRFIRDLGDVSDDYDYVEGKEKIQKFHSYV